MKIKFCDYRKVTIYRNKLWIVRNATRYYFEVFPKFDLEFEYIFYKESSKRVTFNIRWGFWGIIFQTTKKINSELKDRF